MRAAVIVPAYNEGRVIERCLARLQDVPDVRIIVAANGCNDDTVARAERFDVEIVEIPRASKVAALNAADDLAGDVFPRIYLDADIELSRSALELMIERLRSASEPTLASPRLEFEVTDSTRLVRAFYRVFVKMPYVANGVGGSGCYAVNQAGRARWARFPDLFADDLFVQGRFKAEERMLIDAPSIARAPRTVGALLRIRTRTYQGNGAASAAGLAGELHGTSPVSARALLQLACRRRVTLGETAVYTLVNVVARWRAKRLAADAPWLTDHTSRS